MYPPEQTKQSPDVDGSRSAFELTRTTLLADVLPQGGLPGGFSNEGDAIARLLSKVPSALCEELADDWNNHRGEVWKKSAISAGIGLGSAILLARSPVLVKGVMTIMGIGAAASTTVFGSRFVLSAWNADKEQERELLATSTSKTIARVGAELIETTPGFLAGTGSGIFLTSRVAALEAIALKVRHGVDFRARSLVPESLHYVGSDVRTVCGVGRGKGTFDLLRATEEVAQYNPWRGIEEGRFFKTGNGKIKFGSTLPGTTDELIMGRRADHMIHTHADKVLPTSGDFNSVRGTGIVSVPKHGVTTFFEGTSLEAENALALGRAGKLAEAEQALQALHQRTFSSLVIDRTKQLALKVDAKWSPTSGLEPVAVRPVDFSQATQHLRSWNGRTLRLSELSTSSDALLKPGMTELMQRVLQAR